MLSCEDFCAFRCFCVAGWKPGHEPGDGGGQFLAGVGREDFAFRLVVFNTGAREGSF